MTNVAQDVVFQMVTGLTKEEFLRKAGLLRNPEGYGKTKHCPVCKSPIQEERGDLFCINHSLNYERDGKCYWHRYADGTNYWTPASELIKVLSAKTGIPLPRNGL
jgi:hypothetical protein